MCWSDLLVAEHARRRGDPRVSQARLVLAGLQVVDLEADDLLQDGEVDILGRRPAADDAQAGCLKHYRHQAPPLTTQLLRTLLLRTLLLRTLLLRTLLLSTLLLRTLLLTTPALRSRTFRFAPPLTT